MPMPMTETLATSVAPSSRSKPIELGFSMVARRARNRDAREREIGCGAVRRDVLHDHVDVDAGAGERPKMRRRRPACPPPPIENLRLVLEKAMPVTTCVHDVSFVANECTGWRLLGQFSGRSKLERTKMRMLHHAQLDRPHLHDLAPSEASSSISRTRSVHAVALSRRVDRGVDTVDVGIDVAALRLDRTAIATADVSEPPRPSVVMRRFLVQPWSRRSPRPACVLEALDQSSPFALMMRADHARCR